MFFVILGLAINKMIEGDWSMWVMNCFQPSSASTVMRMVGYCNGKTVNQEVSRLVYTERFDHLFCI